MQELKSQLQIFLLNHDKCSANMGGINQHAKLPKQFKSTALWRLGCKSFSFLFRTNKNKIALIDKSLGDDKRTSETNIELEWHWPEN